ncbi:hypothetical protein Pint_27414 [Pistacia integerrima]|uniref:Uncharacterized protein n=1 Tax=Pistacia integerrima TaxID=434235 RepID=A0ACC0YSV7_9ROSI|nr:hypothetical protein Pint_27414 [Pistacia integerrima]
MQYVLGLLFYIVSSFTHTREKLYIFPVPNPSILHDFELIWGIGGFGTRNVFTFNLINYLHLEIRCKRKKK